MTRFALPLAALSVLALAGCSQRVTLEPAAGSALPPAPFGANAQPDADALLAPTPQAAPERKVELRRRSEQRADDPFDLPPE